VRLPFVVLLTAAMYSAKLLLLSRMLQLTAIAAVEYVKAKMENLDASKNMYVEGCLLRSSSAPRDIDTSRKIQGRPLAEMGARSVMSVDPSTSVVLRGTSACREGIMQGILVHHYPLLQGKPYSHPLELVVGWTCFLCRALISSQ
jgi:hypothetical protein